MAISSGLKCSLLEQRGREEGEDKGKRGERKNAYEFQETYKAQEAKLPL